MPQRRPAEISAGGVVARPGVDGWEFCLVLAGRYWGLPKGHLEAGETPVQAALREISEECGIPVGGLALVAELPASEYAYRRGARLIFKLVHHFLVLAARSTELVAQPSEIDEAVWLGLDEAVSRASFADTRVALRAALPLLERALH
jgi:8-oxo-dGTP pyrophosphatase MutT (NUDIX family)